MNSSVISLKINDSQTGRCLISNPYIFQNMPEFKEWVADQFGIPLESLIVLNTQGQRIKESSFYHSNELYAYNKSATIGTNLADKITDNASTATATATGKTLFGNPYSGTGGGDNYDLYDYSESEHIIKPTVSPLSEVQLSSIARDHRQLISVLTTNSSWCTALLSDSIFVEQKINDKINEISTIFKSLGLFMKHLDITYSDIFNKFGVSKDILGKLVEQSLSKDWENYYELLENINLFNDKQSRLSSLVVKSEISQYAEKSENTSNELENKIAQVDKSFGTLAKRKDSLKKSLDTFKNNSIIKNFNNLNLNELLTKLKSLCKAIQKENKEILKDIPNYSNSRSNLLSEEELAKILKILNKHQRESVPDISRLANDLYYLQLNLNILYTKIQAFLSDVMKKSNDFQNLLSNIRSDLKAVVKDIDQLQSYETKLSQVIDLPLLYGLFLLENVRRIEWEAEFKKIVDKTAENFALINENELKYRTKWQKSYGLILQLLALDNVFNINNLINVELSIQKDNAIKEITLKVTRKDVTEYIKNLKRVGVSIDFINLIQNGLQDLANQKLSLYSKFDSYLNFNINKDVNNSDNELIKSYQTRIKKLESILHQHKYKNLNQWPLLFPNKDSRSRSPVANGHSSDKAAGRRHSGGHGFVTSPNPTGSISQPLSITMARSSSTTSVNKIGTLTSTEVSPKPLPAKKSWFQRNKLKFNGNIELTNSVILLGENDKKIIQHDLTPKKNGHKAENGSKRTNDFSSEGDEIDFETIKVPIHDWNELKNNNNLLYLQNRDYIESNQQQSEKIQNLQSIINDQESLIKKLKSDNAEMKHDVEQFNEKVKFLESKIIANGELSEKERLLKNKLKDLETKEKELKASKVQEQSDKDLEISRLKKELELRANKVQEQSEKDLEISTLKKELEQKDKNIKDLKKELAQTDDRAAKLSQDYKDVTVINNDLLANMQSKETDFNRERNLNIEEVSYLKSKIDELEVNEEALDSLNKELITKNANLMNQLIQVVDIDKSLQNKIKNMSIFLFNNFKLICLCFEAVGLLITSNDKIPESVAHNIDISRLNESFFADSKTDSKNLKVLRVRGLRNKKRSNSMNDYNEMDADTPITPLFEEAKNFQDWIKFDVEDEFVEGSSIDIDRFEKETQMLIDTFTSNENFDKRYEEFVSKVVIDYNLIYNSISKRFGDIEHLAKKLQKESKMSKEEIHKLKQDMKFKIAVKNFKINDLVLFLPTKDGENSQLLDSAELKTQPWAAFNIGSPHYFLRDSAKYNLQNRDWLILRINHIEEFKVDEKNYNNIKENPFGLSVGVTWFLIKAHEDKA